MPNLFSEIMPKLEANTFADVPFGEGQMAPHYGGYSILNVPATVCAALGVPSPSPHPPLGDEIMARISPADRVILVVVDGMRWDLLLTALEEGLLPEWQRLAEEGVLAPITSVSPSTTSAALSTLWTARSPTEHGVMGYEMWMRRYGVMANTIAHQPSTYRKEGGSLTLAGFKPQEFLPYAPLGLHFAKHDVKSFAFHHFVIANSSFSKALLQGTEGKSFATQAELWFNLRDLLRSERGKLFVWIYWAKVDEFEHKYSPQDERVLAELHSFGWHMEQYFLKRLTAEERRRTLILITADHGQISTPDNPNFYLRNHPALMETMHLFPGGEHRLMYLYPRLGQAQKMMDYFEEQWPGLFNIAPSEQILRSGLFGPGEPHPELQHRVGDFVAIAQRDAYIWWPEKRNHLLGRHGGVAREEMLVPLLAANLG